VDWCENHKVETIRANVVCTLTLADVYKQSNLLLINFEQGAFFSMTKIISLVVELISRKMTHQICWFILFQDKGHGECLNCVM
jgi:hypothetical protein